MSITTKQSDDIERAAKGAIRTLLKLTVTYRLYARFVGDAQSNWREVEQELSVNYDLKGIGLDLKRDNIDDRVILRNYTVDPGEIVEQIGSFPLEAAVASYAFNQLDEFGNFAAFVLRKGPEEPPVAWHNVVHVKMQSNDKNAFEAARRKFAEVFDLESHQITEGVIESLVRCKKQRNRFVHQGKPVDGLNGFMADIIRVISGITFAICEDVDLLRVHPYTKYEEDIEDSKF